MLGVEVRQVGHQVLDDLHVRQRIDLYHALDVLDSLQARERVRAVDIHGARPADAFAARPAERQRRIDLVLDLDQSVENHRSALLLIDMVGVDVWVPAIVRVPPVDAELFPIAITFRTVPASCLRRFSNSSEE